MDKLTDLLQEENIDIDQIQGFISDSRLKAAEFFKKKTTVLSRKRLSPKWFDNECKDGRKSVRRSLRRFKHDSSNENRRNYVDNKNKYELIMKQNKKKKHRQRRSSFKEG